jgi:hypothetical protein
MHRFIGCTQIRERNGGPIFVYDHRVLFHCYEMQLLLFSLEMVVYVMYSPDS